MSIRKMIVNLMLGIFLIHPSQSVFGQDHENLIQNPTFKLKEGETFPSHWSIWKPLWEPAACEIRPVEHGLQIRSHPKPYAVGGVTQEIKNIQGGQAYNFSAVYWLQGNRLSYHPVLMRVTWLKDKRKLHPAGMFVNPGIHGRHPADFRLQDILIAPDEANGAIISLEVKWSQGGTVTWKSVSMRETEEPKPRKVKIGTVYLRPKNRTPAKNLKLFCDQVDKAGKLGLDIVCLGEVIRLVGTGATINDVAEPIPGPASRQIGAAANKNNIWVVVYCSNKS